MGRITDVARSKSANGCAAHVPSHVGAQPVGEMKYFSCFLFTMSLKAMKSVSVRSDGVCWR